MAEQADEMARKHSERSEYFFRQRELQMQDLGDHEAELSAIKQQSRRYSISRNAAKVERTRITRGSWVGRAGHRHDCGHGCAIFRP
eukprot:3651806-Pyramimonas_sp.AAC.1